MNNFIHSALRHYLQAPEGDASGPAGSAPAAAPAAAPTTPATTEPASTLDALNQGQKTVGELEAEAAAKTAAEAAETPEAKAAREAAELADKTVPETYADYKLPAGVELAADDLAKVNATFKELGLTQVQAQKLIDLQSSLQVAQTSAQAEAMKATFDKQASDWAAEAKADKDLGGDKFDATVVTAQKAMQQFGTPELRDFLNSSGIGNHPQMIKLFHKVGTALSEDKIAIPGSDATEDAPLSHAQAMFGDVKFN